jgi:hypothetical protein
MATLSAQPLTLGIARAGYDCGIAQTSSFCSAKRSRRPPDTLRPSATTARSTAATTSRRIDHWVKAESNLVHPSDPARMHCVTRRGQVFSTEDAGYSWQGYRLSSGVEDVYAIACC